MPGTSHDHGDGENYFVSMTDMMVGLLFIFIIMLMSFALNFRQHSDRQQETTGKLEGKLQVAREVATRVQGLQASIDVRLKEISEAAALRARLLGEVEAQLKAARIEVVVAGNNDVLRFRDDDKGVRFKPDVAELGADAASKVAVIGRVLAAVLPRYVRCVGSVPTTGCRQATQAAVETIFIEGHTDETKGREDNWTLSAARAANTYRELTRVAPELRSFRNAAGNEVLSISGYAETRPIDARKETEAWARNRRIDLRFVMDTDPTPALKAMTAEVSEMKETVDRLLREGQ